MFDARGRRRLEAKVDYRMDSESRPVIGHELIAVFRAAVRWLIIVTPIGLTAGSAAALFLVALEQVTRWQWQFHWLLYLLPVAGLLSGLMYRYLGSTTEAGNNLLIDEIHEPGGGVPLRMAPLVLAGTLLTHLCGGSAGREGTAVQMGGSLASGYARLWRRRAPHELRIILMAGIAAGFGGVFGTPVAGAVFALEVLTIGRLDYAAVFPCLLASLVADWTCTAWGVSHTHYHITVIDSAVSAPIVHVEWLLLGQVTLLAAACGLTSRLFADLTHAIQRLHQRRVPFPLLRPVIGGVLVIGLVYVLGSRDYLGLGVTSPEAGGVSILSSFAAGGAHPWSWLWKLVFTAVTVGSGFKGGEVTPLFFIGAALGNTVAVLLGAPVDLFAGIGLLAVFAGAANTPLACTLMGIELFGGAYTSYFAIGCFTAYLCSGHTGIYRSQRVGTPKRMPQSQVEPIRPA